MFTGHRNSELKEASRFDELKDGLPYMKLQKKLPATMLTHYHRWIYENHRTESVERVVVSMGVEKYIIDYCIWVSTRSQT